MDFLVGYFTGYCFHILVDYLQNKNKKSNEKED